jgi:hypothetical protein
MGGVMGITVTGLPDSIGWVHEDELVRITDVPRSTRQNWHRKSLLAESSDGRYREREVVEVVAVRQLVRALKRLDDVRQVWDSDGANVLAACATVSPEEHLVALIEPRLLRLTLARSSEELGGALRPFESAVAVPLARAAAEARADFWRFAVTGEPLADRRRAVHPPSESAARVADFRRDPG